MALTYVAAYDVIEDGRRARLAALLQAYGDRIQYSVFLLVLDDEQKAAVLTRAADLIDPDTDSLYLLRQCETCWTARTVLGQAQPPEPTLFWAVL